MKIIDEYKKAKTRKKTDIIGFLIIMEKNPDNRMARIIIIIL